MSYNQTATKLLKFKLKLTEAMLQQPVTSSGQCQKYFQKQPYQGNGQKQPPELFCKKSVLKNFAKFTGKHLCQSLFLNKVAGLRLANLLKTRPWHRCFPVNFAKILRTPLGDCFWMDTMKTKRKWTNAVPKKSATTVHREFTKTVCIFSK